jgi:hypothetical protein
LNVILFHSSFIHVCFNVRNKSPKLPGIDYSCMQFIQFRVHLVFVRFWIIQFVFK